MDSPSMRPQEDHRTSGEIRTPTRSHVALQRGQLCWTRSASRSPSACSDSPGSLCATWTATGTVAPAAEIERPKTKPPDSRFATPARRHAAQPMISWRASPAPGRADSGRDSLHDPAHTDPDLRRDGGRASLLSGRHPPRKSLAVAPPPAASAQPDPESEIPIHERTSARDPDTPAKGLAPLRPGS